MQNENRSSYVRVSVASPDTEDDLRKGLLLLKNIFEEKQMSFFVWIWDARILKKDCRNSPFHYFIKFLPFFSYTNTETLYIITETLVLSRKLPSCFRDNTGSFRVCIWVLPASIDFCVIVSSFACEYPSFRDNNRLLPTSIHYQAKQPQNKSSYPRKCKNAPKSTRK